MLCSIGVIVGVEAVHWLYICLRTLELVYQFCHKRAQHQDILFTARVSRTARTSRIHTMGYTCNPLADFHNGQNTPYAELNILLLCV